MESERDTIPVSKRFRQQASLCILRDFPKYDVEEQDLVEVVGCGLAFLEAHLIGTALMNYGVYIEGITNYTIDHVRPLNSSRSLDDLYELSAYSNLQFLTLDDNSRKAIKTHLKPLDNPLAEKKVVEKHDWSKYVRYEKGNLYWTKALCEDPSIGHQYKEGVPLGGPSHRGSRRFHFKRKNYYVHVVIWELIKGPIPAGKKIEHKNGELADNRIQNLRLI